MDGLVLIDKPKDFTSFDVVAVMRGILHERKIGHTGTLDPMATGVLPLLVGKATRLCDIMPVKDKRYIAKIKLGMTTDTLDITGNVLSETDCRITTDMFRSVLSEFVGNIMQKPPMYSAVSKNGQRLYRLARKGIEVERESRPVTVYSADLIDAPDKNEFVIDVACSAGTYIRSLCSDIGEKLGCGGVLTELRRTEACGFSINDCIPLDRARSMDASALVLPVSEAVCSFGCVKVTPAQITRFKNGGPLSFDRIKLPSSAGEYVRVVGFDGTLAGIGRVDREKELLMIKCLF